MVASLARAATLGLLLALAAISVAACSSDDPAAPGVITASLLVETSPGEPTWFRDVEVPKGTDGYELLELATDGELEADFFPAYRSHFVTSLLGVAGESPSFWLTFVWDEPSSAWQPLPVGADLFSVKDGHVLGWALVDTSAGEGQVPLSQP